MKKHLLAGVVCAAIAPMSAIAETAATQPATAATATATTAAATAPPTPGTLSFKANNGMYKADGKFDRWHFTKVEIPDGNIEKGTVELAIELASVSEKAEKLAAHLRAPDFFDVATFATATVSISGAKKAEDGSYHATATVNFHGKTAAVPVTFRLTGEHPMAIDGTASLPRAAFGIGGAPYDPKNDGSIVDDIAVTIQATLPHTHAH